MTTKAEETVKQLTRTFEVGDAVWWRDQDIDGECHHGETGVVTEVGERDVRVMWQGCYTTYLRRDPNFSGRINHLVLGEPPDDIKTQRQR